ncbi:MULTISPECIES: PTS sugar transporter subunit IIA [Clostridia]|uniref:PTS sugar transporter subunit IIA n=1 Tax=Clostridia TaxID=186801 RepID=UPI000EA38FA6|nr:MULTISPECIES: PTS sugar transporter subunit IIA [Clostridia]NBJ70690.1 PTS sugar transporter subunit IIA [Roseburia sp. 1XD42-34]RKI76806.1 PTS sugar transporter subunit IIA [Clostridium sp. 1xD42-85]
MKNIELINEKLIEMESNSTTKEEALCEVATIAYKAERVTNKLLYYKSLVERERESTTGFGNGFAIPHAKEDIVKQPTIIVVRLNNPVDWNSLDNKPVKMLVALAIPKKYKGTVHLKLLANLSENLMEEKFRKQLLYSTNKDGICTTIKNIMEELT